MTEHDTTLDRLYDNPVKRLRLTCESCGYVMGIVWEDDRGLALSTKDRLKGRVILGGEVEHEGWWTDRTVVRVTSPFDDLYLGCPASRKECGGGANSWQLATGYAALERARASGRVVTYTV